MLQVLPVHMWRVHQTHRHNQAFRHNAMPLECIFPTSRTWTASRYRKCSEPRLLQKVGLFRLMLNIIVNSNKQSRSNWAIPEDKYIIKSNTYDNPVHHCRRCSLVYRRTCTSPAHTVADLHTWTVWQSKWWEGSLPRPGCRSSHCRRRTPKTAGCNGLNAGMWTEQKQLS